MFEMSSKHDSETCHSNTFLESFSKRHNVELKEPSDDENE